MKQPENEWQRSPEHKNWSFQAPGSEAEQQEKAEETTCTSILLKSQ